MGWGDSAMGYTHIGLAPNYSTRHAFAGRGSKQRQVT